ncbi:hypothetical protein DFH28DRAFT_891819 [Melampsora americana]|nr:hypothetical protein DFH28DRAFT_891819 [Melampsora americana]
MQHLLDLSKDAQKYSGKIRQLGEKLETIAKKLKLEDQLFLHGSGLETIIITSLEYLQKGDLELYDRLWNLSVLQILQSYLPRGQLAAIRQDPNTGPVCRGALELFLIGEHDCKPRVRNKVNGEIELFPVNQCESFVCSVMKALNRVHLIVFIRNSLEFKEEKNKPFVLRQIHDTLLHTRSLTNGKTVELLTLSALRYLNVGYAQDDDIWCLYHVLQHLGTFYPITPHILDRWSVAGKPFEVIKQRLQCKARLKPDIGKYISEHWLDNQMTKLFEGLTKWESINLNYMKYCLASINYRVSALAESKGQKFSTIWQEKMFYAAQDFLIEMMFRAIPYIEDLEDYLHSQVTKDESSGHYKFISKLSLEDKEESSGPSCRICLGGFSQGERVVDLICHHIFHEECTNNFKCPLCQRKVEIPIPPKQHTTWGQHRNHYALHRI